LLASRVSGNKTFMAIPTPGHSHPAERTRHPGGAGSHWPFPVLSAPPRRPVAGWLLTATGWGIVWVGFVVASFLPIVVGLLLFPGADPEALSGLVAAVVVIAYLTSALGLAFLFLRLGMPVVRSGRSLRYRDALDALAADPRPPILLLRSFGCARTSVNQHLDRSPYGGTAMGSRQR